VKAAEKFPREICDEAGVAMSFHCPWNPKVEHPINDALFVDREKHNVLLCEWTIEEIPSSGDCGFFALFKAVKHKWQNRTKFSTCRAFSTTNIPETLEHFRLILAYYVSRNRKRLHQFVVHSYEDIRQWNLFRNIVSVDELSSAEWSSAIWEKPVFDLISTPAYLYERVGFCVDERVSLYLTEDIMEAIQDLYGLKILLVIKQETQRYGENSVVSVQGHCNDAIRVWPDFTRWRESNIAYVLLDFSDSHFNLYSSRITGLSVLTAKEFKELKTVKACFHDFYHRSTLYFNIMLPYWYERITKQHYQGLCRFGVLSLECMHIADLTELYVNSKNPSSHYKFQCETPKMLASTHIGSDLFNIVLNGNNCLEVESKNGMSVRISISTDGVLITMATVVEFSELNAIILLAMYLGRILLMADERLTVREEQYRNVIITYTQGSLIWNTSEFKQWKTTNNFIQSGRACTFGGKSMPFNVKYYILSAINNERIDSLFTSSESEDPDEKLPAHDPASENPKIGSRTMQGSDRSQQHGSTASSGTAPLPDKNAEANEMYGALLRNLSENDKAARLEDRYDTMRLSTMVNERNGFWLDEEKWKEHKKKRKKVQFMLHPDTMEQRKGSGIVYDCSILAGCNHVFGLLDELYDREVKQGSHFSQDRYASGVDRKDRDANCPMAGVKFRNMPSRKAKEHSIPDRSKPLNDRRIPKRKRFNRSERIYGSSEEDSEEESIFYRGGKSQFGSAFR
jgi:hypothetical protein